MAVGFRAPLFPLGLSASAAGGPTIGFRSSIYSLGLSAVTATGAVIVAASEWLIKARRRGRR